MTPGHRHPNSLAALERYRPVGWAHVPQCSRCRRPAVKAGGKPVCYWHGGAGALRGRPVTPKRAAWRAWKAANRASLVPFALASHPAYRHACERRLANVGALLAMLAAWGASDPVAWARAVRAIV